MKILLISAFISEVRGMVGFVVVFSMVGEQ